MEDYFLHVNISTDYEGTKLELLESMINQIFPDIISHEQPRLIQPLWRTVWETRNASLSEGVFRTPCSEELMNALPSESHNARVAFLTPKFVQPQKMACVVHLAGTGDHTFNQRLRLGGPLLKENLATVVLESPFYGQPHHLLSIRNSVNALLQLPSARRSRDKRTTEHLKSDPNHKYFITISQSISEAHHNCSYVPDRHAVSLASRKTPRLPWIIPRISITWRLRHWKALRREVKTAPIAEGQHGIKELPIASTSPPSKSPRNAIPKDRNYP